MELYSPYRIVKNTEPDMNYDSRSEDWKIFDLLTEVEEVTVSHINECDCDEECFNIHDDSSGDTICSSCGTVLAERHIDRTAEWRNYDSSKPNKSRCGPANGPLFGESLSTKISGSQFDPIVRRHQQFGMNSNDHALWEKFQQVENKLVGSGIPSAVMTDVKLEVKTIRKLMTTRGHKYDAIIGACVYYYCIITHNSRPPKEIAKLMGIEIKYLNAAMSTLAEMKQSNVDVTTINCTDYLSRFCNELKIEHKNKRLMVKLFDEAGEQGCIEEQQPISKISGCIYFVVQKLGLDISKKRIAEVCGVSVVTVEKVRNAINHYFMYFDPDVQDLFPDLLK